MHDHLLSLSWMIISLQKHRDYQGDALTNIEATSYYFFLAAENS